MFVNLKQVVHGHQVTPTLPPTNFVAKLAPEHVLQTQTMARGDDRIQQVFVKWNNLPSSLAAY